MNLKLLFLTLSSVTLSSLAQLLLKSGMSNERIQNSLTHGKPLEAAWQIGLNFKIVGGLSLYALGAVVWLLVLSKIDVSVAYPFVGLGFILTLLFGWLILHEPVTIFRFTGAIIVAFGVYLVSQS